MIPLLICTFFLCCVLVGWLTVTRARASFRLNWSEVEIKMLRADIQQLAELVESSTRRLNRLETKLDSEVVRLEESGAREWEVVEELRRRMAELATLSDQHGVSILALNQRTKCLGTPLWTPEKRVEPVSVVAERYDLSPADLMSAVIKEATDHRTDELSQERDEAQDECDSVWDPRDETHMSDAQKQSILEQITTPPEVAEQQMHDVGKRIAELHKPQPSSLYVTPPGFEPVSSTEESGKTLIYFRQLTCKLHELIKAGKGDTERAEQLRTLCDRIWNRLTPLEKQAARDYSESLYGEPASTEEPR